MKSFTKIGLISAAFATIALSGAAVAQTVLPYVQSINSTDAFSDLQNGQVMFTNVYATAGNLRGWILGGNIIRSAEKPVLTACITGGGTITGTDNAFYITGGSTSSTSCVATFATAYNARPICTVSSETAPGTTTPSYAVSTTAVTITQASGGSNVYDVVCVAQAGG